jgi:hypothetical protein
VGAGFPPASRARLLEKIPFMTPMSIHRNIGIEKDVDPSKHRDRKRCRSIETSGSKKMSIHRNIGIEMDWFNPKVV